MITVQLKYPKQAVRRTEGQSLTLRCTAEYEEEPCRNILVVWCFSVPEECQELIDPDRHLIQVNETKKDGGLRHRDVSVTFTQLTLRDTGFYQCKAVCQHTGATAIGHLINVIVTGIRFIHLIFISKSCALFYLKSVFLRVCRFVIIAKRTRLVKMNHSSKNNMLLMNHSNLEINFPCHVSALLIMYTNILYIQDVYLSTYVFSTFF